MQLHTITNRYTLSARAAGPRRLAALAVLALAGAASGQFTVNVSYDAPAINPAAGCDVDPAVPGDQCTLRSVIQHINTLPPGAYTVDVPAGGYVLNVAGHGEDLGARGDIDVLREITIRGAGVGRTVIDASALGDRIFDRLSRLRFAICGWWGGPPCPATSLLASSASPTEWPSGYRSSAPVLGRGAAAPAWSVPPAPPPIPADSRPVIEAPPPFYHDRWPRPSQSGPMQR